jgi:hypothetical protein
MKLQDEFEDFMDARARELKGAWFDAKVAGVTRFNSDGSHRQHIARTLRPFDELTLEAEPHNPFDPNACALLTPAGEQVGYLEARLALDLARLVAKGGGARCFVRAIREKAQICGVSFALVQYNAAKERV